MNNDTQHDNESAAHCWGRRCKLLYRARLSALYHLKRERFFDGMDKGASAVTAVAATAAVGALLSKTGAYELWAAAVTAAFSLVPLVCNPAQKARHHSTLASEYRRWIADCERAGQRWDEATCDSFGARLLDLETSEPAPLAALIADCQNQLAIAHGDGPVARVRWFHHVLKHWVDMRPAPIPAPAARVD